MYFQSKMTFKQMLSIVYHVIFKLNFFKVPKYWSLNWLCEKYFKQLTVVSEISTKFQRNKLVAQK